ncbi:MAG: hypothetical protein ACI8TP_003309, partial [Acidimicrobiales bacterium]
MDAADLTRSRNGESRLRGSAGRWILGAPSISVVDESGDHEHGGGEAECGVAVAVSPVGVAPELTVVRPPRVGGFNDPSQPERESVR